MEELAESFQKTKTDITWGITLVLMFRSVGSIIFGIAADRYGRKWPFIVNNLLFIILELVSLFLMPPSGPWLPYQALRRIPPKPPENLAMPWLQHWHEVPSRAPSCHTHTDTRYITYTS